MYYFKEWRVIKWSYTKLNCLLSYHKIPYHVWNGSVVQSTYSNIVWFTDNNTQYSENSVAMYFWSDLSARAEQNTSKLDYAIDCYFSSFHSFLLLRCKDPALHQINFRSILSFLNKKSFPNLPDSTISLHTNVFCDKIYLF